jgi:NDP-sugar pyrophosphorylase family protein
MAEGGAQRSCPLSQPLQHRQINRAVLLAAGRGKRLGEITRNLPKPLLKIGGKPLIGRIVESLGAADLSEIAIVTGYLADQIERWCKRWNRESLGVRLRTFRQGTVNGTAGALLAAREFVAHEEIFLFGWGDILMDRNNYFRFTEAARCRNYDLLLAVNRVDDPWRGAAVYVTSDMRVARIIEKPAPGTSATYWNSAGLFATSPMLFEYLDRVRPSPRGELEVANGVGMMLDAGCTIRAFEIRGRWCDVGTPEDFKLALASFRTGPE